MLRSFSPSQLRRLGPQRTFSGASLAMVAFPLGGIGTGSVSLSGLGGLVDWEIFNRPNMGSALPKTFPILWAREKGKDPVCRVVQAPPLPPYQGGGGGDPNASGEGFPHMDSCAFQGEYPFAQVNFESKRLPVRVSLEAYNPFIPSNADDSGFPAAILRYTLRNTTKKPVDVSLAWSLFNPIGTLGNAEKDQTMNHLEHGLGKNVNTRVEEDGIRGLLFSTQKYAKDHPRYGTMTLTTPDPRGGALTHWQRAPWFTPVHDFWDHFSATGEFPCHNYGPSDDKNSDAGAVSIQETLSPGEAKTFTFYLTWHFPNFEKYWHDAFKPGRKPVWKNFYAGQFTDALDVAKKLQQREPELYTQSKQFHDALFSSTLPPYVLEAISSQMAILKTTTCIRLTDGTFYGFEGCAPVAGCCDGSCTHVWNYQQTLPFLFPALERSMRAADYRYNLSPNGHMGFRLQLPLGEAPSSFHACADGQMGGVIKTYRDWKISGDGIWLANVWPDVKKALEYAWIEWDKDKNGVMEEIQHNTYDIEFLGPNPLMGLIYLGALTAAAEIADYLHDHDSAAEYRAICKQGRAWIEANLFNGEYYVQKYDPEKAPTYQFGEGCLADQLLGQCMAIAAGLGPLLDRKHLRAALKSIFKYNWKSDLSDHANAQRVYALDSEAGLLLCSWPNGHRPAVPFPYSDEVWTGIEYQVAAHLIHEDLINEGLAIVKGVQDRHDGIRRNPWNQFECGNHYARAMSAYTLLLTLSGFTYDRANGVIGFDPKLSPENFCSFWALDGCWGLYRQKRGTAALEVWYGAITLQRLELSVLAKVKSVRVTPPKGKGSAVAVKKGALELKEPVVVKAGEKFTCSF